MIAENQHLIPKSYKKKYAQKAKYLVLVTDLEEIKEDNAKDPVTDRLDLLKVEIELIKSQLKIQNH